jgi:luciferase family oxidoreductase group 1
VLELQSYFEAPADQVTRAVPGAGLKVPIWLLGSSLYSAQLAALLGLPFAFAAHFAPELLLPALAIYRSRFTPSAQLARPYAMICVNLVVAETERAAQRLFSSHQQAFTQLRRGRPGPAAAADRRHGAASGPRPRKSMIARVHALLVRGLDAASVRAGLEHRFWNRRSPMSSW